MSTDTLDLDPTGATADEVKELEPPAPPEPKKLEEDDDDHQEDSARNDAELDAARTDEERERIREARRQERRERKNRQKDRFDRLERELAQQRQINEQLMAGVARLQSSDSSSRMAQLDRSIGQAETLVTQYKEIISEASTKNDGPAVAEATELMIAARERLGQLKDYRQRVVAAANKPPAQQLDPQMVSRAQEFMGRHTWYKGSEATDPDSMVLTTVDNALAREGWNPSTEGYWQELEKRAAKYLPHRFNAVASSYESRDNHTKRTGASPVPGAAGDRSGNSGENAGYTISAERVRAMKEAGVWDDPARRKAMIDRYRQHDAAQR